MLRLQCRVHSGAEDRGSPRRAVSAEVTTSMLNDSAQEGSYAIGIDVGGTKCAAGLVDVKNGRVFAWRLRPTESARGGEAVLGDVIDLARSLQEEAARMGTKPVAIGVCVAELVDQQGQVLSDATIRWRGVEVRARIERELSLPVHLNADVRAAARGEALFGAGRGCGSFLYVTVGTGISACLVIGGVPFAGARNDGDICEQAIADSWGQPRACDWPAA